MIQPQALSIPNDTDVEPVPDPWSTWAQVVDLATPADESPAEPVTEAEPVPELATVVAQLAAELADERRRGDALDGERAALLKRVQDAWLAAAVLRRSRPLRPRSSMPATAEAAQQEVLEALDENETDPAFAAESPELAGEIEELRQRLRGQVHKPAEIDEVEDGVEDLRVLRLAREQTSSNRRRK